MIAAYLRVSSRAQNVRTQQDAIVKAARARGDRITRWFVESASARTMKRPELQALIQAAAAGEISTLWVFKLDRLTRTGIRDTLNLLNELKTYGCQVKSVADGFALEGPQAEVILAVMAWGAQMERQAIGDRIAAARERVESQGGTWGRPSRVDDHTRSEIARLKRCKVSVRMIAQTLRIPKSTVQRELSRNADPREQQAEGTQLWDE